MLGQIIDSAISAEQSPIGSPDRKPSPEEEQKASDTPKIDENDEPDFVVQHFSEPRNVDENAYDLPVQESPSSKAVFE